MTNICQWKAAIISAIKFKCAKRNDETNLLFLATVIWWWRIYRAAYAELASIWYKKNNNKSKAQHPIWIAAWRIWNHLCTVHTCLPTHDARTAADNREPIAKGQGRIDIGIPNKLRKTSRWWLSRRHLCSCLPHIGKLIQRKYRLMHTDTHTHIYLHTH